MPHFLSIQITKSTISKWPIQIDHSVSLYWLFKEYGQYIYHPVSHYHNELVLSHTKIINHGHANKNRGSLFLLFLFTSLFQALLTLKKGGVRRCAANEPAAGGGGGQTALWWCAGEKKKMCSGAGTRRPWYTIHSGIDRIVVVSSVPKCLLLAWKKARTRSSRGYSMWDFCACRSARKSATVLTPKGRIQTGGCFAVRRHGIHIVIFIPKKVHNWKIEIVPCFKKQ